MNGAEVLCQTCESVTIKWFLSLGNQPLCVFPDQDDDEPTWPLDLGFCPNCSLVQLMSPVSERILFSGEYHHLAGLTEGFRDHLEALAITLASYKSPDPGHRRLIEIGSNDGSLLDALAERGFEVLGIDPCGQESPKGSRVVAEFFSTEVAERLMAENAPANLVVATNVFAHVSDPHDVVEGIARILDEEGMFVSESHYLPEMLNSLQYDFAYHEHSRYYSLTALQHLFDRHGMEVFHVEPIDTHGGSLRVFAGFRGAHPIQDSVSELRAREDEQELTAESTYRDFAGRVQNHREEFRRLVQQLSDNGSVVGSSCPARAVTLLNYCQIGTEHLDYVTEISPLKIGHLFPGVHLPVVSQEKLCGQEQPDYVLLFSWHILEELKTRLRNEGYRGKFVVALPEPRVLTDA